MKANEVLSCTKEKAELGIECQSKHIDRISPALGAGRIEVASGHLRGWPHEQEWRVLDVPDGRTNEIDPRQQRWNV